MKEGLGFSENAVRILKSRYYLKNEKGDFIDKSPADLFRRVAAHVASAERTPQDRTRWAQAFFEAMIARDFLPNSPTLTGAGRDMCLSACFVLPLEDSMESIFTTVKNAALVHKEGGGTGFDFSRLRGKGSFVHRTQGVASGPVSFLKVIDAATEAVKQGGTRRGANMGILRVDHPDIEDFILMKKDGRSGGNFNISVAATDAFMTAVKEGTTYEVFDPYKRKVIDRKDARKVFRMIVESAWAIGDPGLIFIDRINKANPTKGLGPISATNPCGEQPLHPYESCNLGSINIANFHRPESQDGFDGDRFGRIIDLAVRFLDNVIDVNKYPLPEVEAMSRGNRRIGLGLMGWADLLIKMKIRYDAPEAFALADKVGAFLRRRAAEASAALARRRGNFPNIAHSVYKGRKMRNATVFTIAPTGTISRIAGCSSSIEPVFAFEFTSRILDAEIKDLHPLYAEWKTGHPDEPVPDHFVTAHEIPPEGHIRMQAAFQRHVDNSVSKTINLPHEASLKDVETAYLLAYDLGTKGITIYRDGCREEQVLTKGGKPPKRLPEERPDTLTSTTDKIKTGFGNLYITITFFNQKPFEVFASIGKSGYSTMADAEAIGRLISLALRSGVDPKEVVNQLKGIGGSEPIFTEGGLVTSIPDAIAKVLERHFGEGKNGAKDMFPSVCRQCGATLPDEKCPVCPNCGWNKCS
ncbi:MAG: adenosylcobalamin-dependent ribonucleoside-diphosphate reductase [Candidatus Aminicenantes bacterium]|nr:adenosylcobalamin-dependent ribonucleoside-diphosphate reductase [Candidatus Aminicenantes bacterium]